MNLKDLRKGQAAIIEQLSGASEECQHLISLGFSAGAMVRMVAPGSPCVVQVRDARVMLRGRSTELVEVSLV